MNSTDSYESASPSRRRERAVEWMLAVVAAAVVLIAFKLVPGTLPSAHTFLIDTAFAECLQNTGEMGREGCANFGFPSGATKAFGLPVSLAAKVFFGADGTVSLEELRWVYTIIMMAAFALACVFFRRVSASWSLGVLGAALYLLSPVVLQQSGYGSLQLGFALIPGYVIIDSLLLSTAGSGRVRRVALAAVAVLVSRTFALYLDGYSFTFSSILTLVYFLAAALPRNERRSGLLAAACYVVISAIAAVLYKQYISESALSVMPISFFRGAGVDVATLIAPISSQWPYRLAGIGLDLDPDMVYGAFGDSSGLIGTFVGYSYLTAAIVLCWLLLRRKLEWNQALSTAVVVTGLIALGLSLGPSFKFFDFREAGSGIPPGAFERYLMRPDEATFNLPTGWIYEHVPGIKNIRALARWLVLTRLAFILALITVAAYLLRSNRRKMAAVLVLAALLETAPNLADAYRDGRRTDAYATAIYDRYPKMFSEGVRPGERTLLLQLHDNANSNEFASDFLCAHAGALCFNAGGDKASLTVQAHWPREILEAKWQHNLPDNLRDALRKDMVDVVAVPLFDLRQIVYSEAAAKVPVDVVRARATALAATVGANVTHNDLFLFLRKDDRKFAAGGQASECGIACWRSWPLIAMPQQIQWGPRDALPGELFNGQPGGYSAIWVKLSDPEQRYTIAFDGALVATNANPEIVVGLVPYDVSTRLKSKTDYPVYLVDRKERARYKLGDIRVR